ncbi:MFS transporter [Catellatospora sp. NEAU-YM18]|nr:MFS transporter [Catellatospora tritici]
MVVLDVSVVNVALPAIGDALHFGAADLQWTVNAYALAFAGFLLLGGRAADIVGRRAAFVAGIGLFTLASLVGGLATNAGVLVAARFVQGIGAAVLAPATLTILTTSFPEGPGRAKAIGTWSAVGAAGGAAGSLIGGLLTGYLSWRWVLLINVPVGVLAVVGAVLLLTGRAERTRPKVDVFGAIAVTSGLFLLEYGVVQSHDHGWATNRTLLPLVAGLVLLAVFVWWQTRSAHPLLPLRLFRTRSVSGANTVMALLGGAFFSMWFLVSLYLQNVRGFGPVAAGVAFLPHTLTIVVAARSSPYVLKKITPGRLVLIATVLAAAGFLLQSRAGTDTGVWLAVIVPGMLISAGMGLAFTPIAMLATSGVASTEAGLVSGLLNTSRQIGGSVGLAALATLAAARTSAAAGSGEATPQDLLVGYQAAFLVSAVLVILGSIATLLLLKPLAKPGQAG